MLGEQVLMQMMWLKIDVGLPRVLRRRTAFSTPRAPDGCVDDCVKYQTPTLRIIDYSTADHFQIPRYSAFGNPCRAFRIAFFIENK
jgi:hypothetical protein